MTRDAVEAETPASRATSVIVARLARAFMILPLQTNLDLTIRVYAWSCCVAAVQHSLSKPPDGLPADFAVRLNFAMNRIRVVTSPLLSKKPLRLFFYPDMVTSPRRVSQTWCSIHNSLARRYQLKAQKNAAWSRRQFNGSRGCFCLGHDKVRSQR
jgi:hypothetical protein